MDVHRRLARRLGRPVTRSLTVVAAVALVAATPACAQEEGGGEEEEMQPTQEQTQQVQEVQRLQQEIQQLQQRLSQIQQQAMQDSGIQEDYTELQETVRAAMTQLDPEAGAKEDSLTSLQQQMSQAQQEQDTARMQGLMTEGQALSRELNQLRDSVMQRDSLQEIVEDLRADLEAEMTSINDSVPTMMARRDSLMQRLQQLADQLRGQGMPGGGGQGAPPGGGQGVPPGGGQGGGQ